MKHNRIGITLALSTMILLAGCAHKVNEEVTKVEAEVSDVRYVSSWIQPVLIGKVTTFITHSAEYIVEFSYDNLKTTVDDKIVYEKYKDKIGEKAKCELIKIFYDNGKVKRKLKYII